MLLSRLICFLFGHQHGRRAEDSPWATWTRYHCPSCDRWTLCLGDAQFTVNVYGEHR